MILDADGHGIWSPQVYLDAGFPAEVVDPLTREHRSGEDWKSTIFVGGKAVKSLKGVHHLSMLARLGRLIGAENRATFHGRGRNALAWCETIGERLLEISESVRKSS